MKANRLANRFRFRAWDKSKKKMVENFSLDADGYIHYEHASAADCWFTLMQSTGLTDKRGREIFEGDILRRGNVVPFRCFAVKWGNIENHEYECVDGTGWMFSPDILVECEVVGNIYQNPELLKG